MDFIEHISDSLVFAGGAGARNLRWLAVCALLAAAGLAQFNPRRAPAGPAMLHGEAAVQQLKTEGGYASLSAALSAARYQINAAPAQATQSGQSGAPYYANNPGQQLRATFAPDEVRISAASNKADGDTDGKTDGAGLRLQLAGYGYGEQFVSVTAGEITANGDRIELKKSAIRNQPGPQSAITEWYVNRPEGLEQGFTLTASPAPRQTGEWLRVALSVGAPGSGWRASVRGDGQGALFELERQVGGLQLGYDHLAASDAQGRALPARMALEGDTLTLLVDDAQAVYPLTIDPILAQQQKLAAADGAADDQFGAAVALGGNTAIIGAPFNGVAEDAQGAVYVFVRNGANWSLQQKLTANDGTANDFFGHSVALSGDTVVVGAPNDAIRANNTQGSAYVFTRSGTVWTQQQKLTASDGATNDFFGHSVAVSGDTVVVGASFDDIGANEDQGSAYVFIRSGVTWTLQQKLTSQDGGAFDDFGFSVALSGDTLVAGAPLDTIGANIAQGSACVFTRSGTVWTQQQKLIANDGAANDNFGFSVALSGNTVVVGALFDAIGATVSQGSAYVFIRGFIGSGATWTQQQKLFAQDGAAGDLFGFSVALSGDTLVVGTEDDDIGTHGNQGSAYVFSRSFIGGGAVWTQQRKLTDDGGAAGDQFGRSVAFSGDTVMVGVPLGDIGTTTNQGSAYVFVVRENNFLQQQSLTANDGADGDNFGISVALSGDTVVAGAPNDDIGANAAQGSAYVFVRGIATSGAGWTFQQKLIANDGATADFFGNSVAISGDTVVVGAREADNGANGNQGSAYVFTRNGTTWTLQQKLLANDGEAFDNFGFSVAISGDTVVVGAPLDFIGADGEQGAAYIFTRTGTVWTQRQKLLFDDGVASNEFGFSVAISGDTVVVGTPFDTIGMNQAQGSAYVYVRSGTTWTLQQKLTANDGAPNDQFGLSVALSGDTVVVSAPFDNIDTNADQGSAYVFVRGGTTWTLQQKLTANDGAAKDRFGLSVALSGDTAVVGAFRNVGGPLSTANQGSAYVFTRGGTVWTRQQRLVANDGMAADNFGTSIGVSGDTVVVGATAGQGAAYTFVCPACPIISLNPDSLPGGVIGNPYSQTVTASSAGGGTGPYQFSLSEGALPPGLILEQNGQLSGTPTAAGAYRFTITATILGSLCPGSRSYILTVTPLCPTLTLNPATLPAGKAGVAYSQQLSGSGGTAPYSFALVENFVGLPGGLTLTPGGLLSGTPTAFGTFDFTLRATDVNGCRGTRDYSLTITPPCPTITVNPAPPGGLPGGLPGGMLPDGTVCMVYQQTVTASGGAEPYSFTLSAGTLPTGLSLAANGALSGTPSVAGSFNFTLRATDANGCQGTQAYSVTINGGTANNGLQFYPLAHPVRLLDTRPGQAGCFTPGAPIAGGTSRTQPARGNCDGLGIPDNAKVVTGNITTVQSGGGFLTLYPSDAAQPLAAHSNYAPNEIVNNIFTVALGADGAFNIFALNTTDVVVDVTGYYAPPGAGGLYFHPLPKPIRLLETRAGFPGCTAPGVPLPGGADTPQLARLTCDGVTIPPAAQAITGNATTVNPQGPGSPFLTLFPADAAKPLVASSNYLPRQVMNAPFTVGLSAAGEFKISPTTQTDLVIDVLGYYSADATDVNGAGSLFNPLPKPVRLLETRAGFTGCSMPGAPLASGSTRTQGARGVCDGVTIAANARGIIGNATVVLPQGGGFLTFWPSDAARPLVASSNFTAGQVFNRHFTVGLGNADGAFKIFTSTGTDLVIDVSGFFAP